MFAPRCVRNAALPGPFASYFLAMRRYVPARQPVQWLRFLSWSIEFQETSRTPGRCMATGLRVASSEPPTHQFGSRRDHDRGPRRDRSRGASGAVLRRRHRSYRNRRPTGHRIGNLDAAARLGTTARTHRIDPADRPDLVSSRWFFHTEDEKGTRCVRPRPGNAAAAPATVSGKSPSARTGRFGPLGYREGLDRDTEPRARRPAIPRARRRPAESTRDSGRRPGRHTEGEMSRLFSGFFAESAVDPAARISAALVAGFLGFFLLFAVGFAQVAHDAAHDSRHSVAFPCH